MPARVRLNLRGKLILTFLLSVGVALGVTVLTIGGLAWLYFAPADGLLGRQSQMQERADAIAAAMLAGRVGELRKAAVMADLPPGAELLVIDMTGTVWYDSAGGEGRRIEPGQVLRWLPSGQETLGALVVTEPLRFEGQLYGYYVYLPPPGNRDGTPLSRVSGTAMLGGQAFALLVCLLLFLNFGRRLVEPVRRLSAVVRRIADGDLSARTSLDRRSDELGHLAADVDRMADRLEQSRQQAAAAEESRRYTVAAVSHDLRSPLTALLAHAEALETGVADDPGRSLAVITQKGHQLKQLIDDLFELAALDADQSPWRTSRTDVAEVVRQCVAGWLPQFEAAGMAIDPDIPEAALVADLPPGKLERVLDNLLGNALKYAADGGWLGVQAALTGGMIRIVVADHGPGIPADEQSRIFDQFYRAGAARTGTVRGSGLGLAVARRTLERMGGRIGVESPPAGGARFWVELPAAPPES